MTKLIINTDGGSRGNPGPSAIGIVIRSEDNSFEKTFGSYIGITTNNQAEYSALVEALTQAKELNPSEIECRLDSELVVKQLNGQYQVKDAGMKTLYAKAKDLEKNFKKITYKNIPRAQNSEADAIVNQVLDTVESQNATRKS